MNRPFHILILQVIFFCCGDAKENSRQLMPSELLAVNRTWHERVYPELASAEFPVRHWLSACVNSGRSKESICCHEWEGQVQRSLPLVQEQMSHLLAAPTLRSGRGQVLRPYVPTWKCNGALERVPPPQGKQEDDGSKWMCGFQAIGTKAASQSCVTYSFGSNANVVFEKAVKKQHPSCDIITFDPTLNSEKTNIMRKHETSGLLKFVDQGLGFQDGTISFAERAINVSTLRTLVRKLGHNGKMIDILKVDIEGAEFGAIFSRGGLRNCLATYRHEDRNVIGHHIGQILMEVHVLPSDSSGPTEYFLGQAKTAQLFATFYSCGFMIFHREKNPLAGRGGLYEYSLVSSSQAFRAFESSQTDCKP
uniref:Methyltransferase domain-containing protein n=1 Tax=Chrysotila carterae TaxID=13221 RepID=A0A7S4FBP5_CHRCT